PPCPSEHSASEQWRGRRSRRNPRGWGPHDFEPARGSRGKSEVQTLGSASGSWRFPARAGDVGSQLNSAAYGSLEHAGGSRRSLIRHQRLAANRRARPRQFEDQAPRFLSNAEGKLGRGTPNDFERRHARQKHPLKNASHSQRLERRRGGGFGLP